MVYVTRLRPKQETRFFVLLLAPAAVVVAILTLYPVLRVATDSFFDYDFIAGTRDPVGLENYRSVLRDPQFREAAANTLRFVVMATAAETLAGFGLALLFYRPVPFKRGLTLLVTAPMMLSTMVVSATWRTLYHYDIGLLNHLATQLGAPRIGWLINPDLALASVALVDLWQWTPFVFVILSAALRTIPSEYIEAARIDGAGSVRLLRHIIVPLLGAQLLMVALLRTIDTFRLFAKVYALTGGGPGNATETISYFIYREAFSFFNLGRAGAASILAFALIAIVAVFYIPRILGGDR